MVDNSIKNKVIEALDSIELSPGASIMVSLSGGSDSTALLHILCTLKSSYGFTLSALYIDHGMRSRGELDKESGLVEHNCRLMGIPVYFERIEAGAIKRQGLLEKRSQEEIARERRYGFFDKFLKTCDYIALGHILDDSMETQVMRFFQGSGYGGLTGIPMLRDRYIRPLTYCTKKEILEYLSLHNIAYSTDSTNLTDDYLRNRVRHKLIPVVEEIFPGYRNALRNLAGKLGMIEALVESERERRISPVKISGNAGGDGYTVSFKSFVNLPEAVKLSLIYKMFHDLNKSPHSASGNQLPFRFLKPLLEAKNSRKDEFFLKGHGIRVIKKEDVLFFQTDIVYNSKKGYLIVLKNDSVDDDSEVLIDTLHFKVEVSKRTGYPGNSEGMILSRALIRWPLIIRTRRVGDRIKFENHSRKLKKILIDWQVRGEFKNMIPVLEDRTGILGVIGMPLGYKNIANFAHDKKKINFMRDFLEIRFKEIKFNIME